MNKYLYIIGIVVLSLNLVSCEDYLTIPAESQFDSETVFSDVSTAEMAVLACYPYTFNREIYYQMGMGTDCCFSTESETNSKNQIGNYVYTTSNSPSSTYNAMYYGIEYANSCIYGLNNLTSTSSNEEEINQLLGESYTIRAMNYWNLIRFFGDVPFPTEPSSQLTTFTSSRVSRDTIYDNIISDLQKATELLAWKSDGLVTTTERVTKNAAYGILARVALYAAGYSLRWDLDTYSSSSVELAQRDDESRIKELYKIAADACEAVISQNENSLLSSYETVFRDLMIKEYNDETMLEIGQYGANCNGYAIGYTNGISCHKSSTFQKTAPAMHVIPTYWFDFDDNDTRRGVAICNYGIDSGDETVMNTYVSNTIGKFRVVWKTEVGTAVNKRDINWPMLRYSDVLLMYAEALNEYNDGPTTDAINALKEVRLRAFNNDESLIGDIPSNYDDFKTAIIKERKLELAFEGLRRTDLIRWGLLYSTLTQTKQDIIDMANRTGNYAGIDSIRVYEPETLSFASDLVSLDYTGYETLSTADSTSLVNEGYTVINMLGSSGYSYSKTFYEDASFITSLYRGLVENQSELLPLNQTIIDVNSGLEGQQLPLY